MVIFFKGNGDLLRRSDEVKDRDHLKLVSLSEGGGRLEKVVRVKNRKKFPMVNIPIFITILDYYYNFNLYFTSKFFIIMFRLT